ncbi:hypothetical protein [Carboxylicivirga caseinilyticus]|uniref:hypothetical protein n=1 Tax=Carboxylicivirga caseinilyticus TaxID=3417572 RepID=UPI003D34B13C|nr:hypothetical protein [Marinilabiliaceae bacterium A049]
MKIETISGKTDRKVRIYKPVSEVVITKNGNWNGEKVEISRVSGAKGTHEQVSPRMLCEKLFEVASQGEGLFIDKNTGSRGIIAVGMDGAAALSDQRYLEVDLSSLDAAKSYEVYGMEDGEIVERVIVYHPITINSDETLKEYGVADKELGAFPLTDLVKIELIKTNGQSVTYTPTELMAKMEKENDLCAVQDTGAGEVAFYGFKTMALVAIADVETVKIEKSAGNSYELIFIDQA